MRVRYYGTVGLPTGYGDAGNEFCMAMLAAGIDLEILTAATQLHKDYAALGPHIRSDDHPPTPSPDVVIVHNLPLSCVKTLEAARVRETCPGALLVAYTTWEGLRAPQELLDSLSAFSQVWVPSRRTALAIDHGDTFATRIIPHATDDRPFGNHTKRVDDAPYRFYSVGAWTARKNMEGVVRAYLRAFDKGDNVELIMHCHGAAPDAAYSVAVAATGKMPSDLPVIRFSNERLTGEEIRALHHGCDCFVSASRGESWNIPAFDAMRAGSYIVATEALGHEEFLRHTNYWPIDSWIVPASGEVVVRNDSGRIHGQYMGGDCLTVKQSWREPALDRLAELMKLVAKYRPALTVYEDPRELFGRAEVGRLIKAVLEQALGGR